MIRVSHLSIGVGTFHLDNVSFEIPSGAYGVLMGRSGCGKTTLLESLCGLRPALKGSIHLGDREATLMKAAEREIGYVPQDRALFQTMTVRNHLAFALHIRRWNPDAIRKRVGELADLLGLSALLGRYPHGLSGGESQRVALGRALAFRPAVLCLDEPLTALDDETREAMYVLLRSVQKHTGVTTLHVTHHREDAQRLANVLLKLDNGRVVSERLLPLVG